MKASLAARDAEVIDTRQKLDHALAEGSRQAEQRWQEETRASLAKAEAEWKAGEALRLAAAEAQWQEDVAPALAEAEARLDAADAELAKARAQAQGDDVELHFLREELQEVKASLTLREAELAEARSMAAQLRQARRANVGQLHLAERLLSGSIEAQREAAGEESAGPPAPAPAPRHQPQAGRRLIGIGALLLVLVMAVIAYPHIEQMLRGGLRPEILPPRSEPTLRTSEPPSPKPAEVAERRAVIGVSDAKLRSGPSTVAAVIATLPRGTEVTPLERRGDWVLIRTGGGHGTGEREGWVFRSSLKEG